LARTRARSAFSHATTIAAIRVAGGFARSSPARLDSCRTRCAICRLRHENLLDAAHILEDRHERGLPEVPNGLALYKIHHSAYDVNILGVSPDYRVHIRADVLREHDGPMLRWGLQERDVGTRQPSTAASHVRHLATD